MSVSVSFVVVVVVVVVVAVVPLSLLLLSCTKRKSLTVGGRKGETLMQHPRAPCLNVGEQAAGDRTNRTASRRQHWLLASGQVRTCKILSIHRGLDTPLILLHGRV